MKSNDVVSTEKPNGGIRGYWLRGVSYGVFLQIVALVLGFVSSVFLARALGPEGFGQYSYILAIVAVLSVISALGIPTVIVRLIAKYLVTERFEMAKGLLHWANILVGGVATIFSIVVLLMGVYLQESDESYLTYLASSLIIILALSTLRQKTLQGLHHPIAAQLPEQLVKHVIFLFTGLMVWWFSGLSLLSPVTMMMVWVFANLANFLAGAILLRYYMPKSIIKADKGCDKKYWITLALPIFFADMSGTLFGNSDILILGIFSSASDVGYYRIAVQVSGLLTIVLTASNLAMAPWFSRLHANGDMKRLEHIIVKTTQIIFVLGSIIFLIIVFGGEILLNMFFGEEYLNAYPILIVLGCGQMVNLAVGPVVSLLAMTGGQRYLAIYIAGMTALNIILCFLLIPEHGMLGAAYSTAFTLAVYNVLLAWRVRKYLKIGTTIFG